MSEVTFLSWSAGLGGRREKYFYFHVRFFRVFALLGASVIGAGLKTPGTRR